MFTTRLRAASLPALATATVVALAALPLTAAVADTDPVTGGSAVFTLSTTSSTAVAVAGRIGACVNAPATAAADSNGKAVDVTFPVIGGDASTNTLYGVLKLDGSVTLTNRNAHRTVTLSDFTFDISADQISATPSTGGDPVVLLDALGNHDYTTTQPETFSASSLKIDPAGAKFLDAALKTGVFHSHRPVGSFSASWTNTVDGG